MKNIGVKIAAAVTSIAVLAIFVFACQSGPTVMGAASPGPIFNPNWTIPAWFIDGSNSTGCASDSNTGTSGTPTCVDGKATGGIGPLSTYAQLAYRWNTYSPRIQQVTTITSMSPMVASDPIYIRPYVEGANIYVNWTCSLGAAQQVYSTTTTAATHKVRATPTLPNFTIAASSINTNQLLNNTTKSSWAWSTMRVGASPGTACLNDSACDTTQPMTGCSSPQTSCVPAEDDDWTTGGGDAIVAYSPSTIYMIDAEPISTQSNLQLVDGGSLAPAVKFPPMIVQGCTIGTLNAGSLPDVQSFTVNQNVQLVNDLVYSTVNNTAGTGGAASPQGIPSAAFTIGEGGAMGFVNVMLFGSSNLNSPTFYAGAIGRNIFGVNAAVSTARSPYFAGDPQLWPTSYNITDAPVLGEFNASSNAGPNVTDGLYTRFRVYVQSGFFGLNAPIWGEGSIDVGTTATLGYVLAAGSGVSTFLLSSIKIAGSTQGCNNTIAAPAVVNCARNINGANLDLSVGLGGFNQSDGGLGASNAFRFGGGTINNSPQ